MRDGPLGINDAVLRRWVELLEEGQLAEPWRGLLERTLREVLGQPAHVVDVPGTTIESLLERERRGRDAGTDTRTGGPQEKDEYDQRST